MTTQQTMDRFFPVSAVAAGLCVQPASRWKSQRGRQLKTLQYDVVTFYSRTGRWESQIWSISLSSSKLLRSSCSNLLLILLFMHLHLSSVLLRFVGIIGSKCTWNTDVALAFELPGGWLKEKDFATASILQGLLGGGGGVFSWGRPRKGLHSCLNPLINEFDQIKSISAFKDVHSNTGIFGIIHRL